MITAAEARKQSENKNNSLIHEQMTKVEAAVKDSVSRGLFGCYVSSPLDDRVVNKLRELGYEVNIGSDYNDVSYCIKW